VRSFSIDCNVDGGGLPFIWLTGVAPAQSVALLESLVPGAERRVMNGAVSAIAMHRDGAADAALDRLSAPSTTSDEETRRQVAFWMGNARGRHGFESLQRMLRDDPSDRVREHVVFAMTQSKESGAIPAVVVAAREDKSPRVRQQALFYLAQRAERQISEDAIRRAIEQDPETSVKKRAVFALTQIKNGDGVPMLIEIAKGNKNPVVRKEAMHWLGQSKDARAVAFFESVLR
jgi:HEAT repeat protein